MLPTRTLSSSATTIEKTDTAIIVPPAVFAVTLPKFSDVPEKHAIRITVQGDSPVTVLNAEGSFCASIPARPSNVAVLSTAVFRRASGSTNWTADIQ